MIEIENIKKNRIAWDCLMDLKHTYRDLLGDKITTSPEAYHMYQILVDKIRQITEGEYEVRTHDRRD